MTAPKRKFVDGSYGQIHLRIAKPEYPTKRPLVCAHMFPQSGRNFEAFVEAASEDRIVVALDFPGYGESTPPPHPISAAEYARSVWEVVDALSLCEAHGDVDLFGIHAGAKLTAEAVRQRPQDVNRVLLSSAAVMFPEEVARLKSVFTPIVLDEEGTRFNKLWEMVVKNRSPDMTLEMCAAGFAEMLRGGERYEWGHHAVFEYNLQFPDVLKSITHPVALLNPRDDLYAMTPRAMEYLPNAKLIDLPDWSHGFLEVHADKLTKLVHAWCDDTSSSTDDKVNAQGLLLSAG